MIDLHCHLIPGIDDGPATMDDSLALARAAARAGTGTIVATPHIDHNWGVEPEQVDDRASAVREAIAAAGVEVEVLTGGEVALSRFVELRLEELDAVRLGDGPYVLLECPHTAAAGNFDEYVLALVARGERIVLAHPERSPVFHRRPERLGRIVESGALCSITAASLRGVFGSSVRSFTLELLRAELVHNVASDSHDAQRRGPDLGSAFEAAEPLLPGVSQLAGWLTQQVPAAILAGEPLPPRPSLPPPRLRDKLLRRKR